MYFMFHEYTFSVESIVEGISLHFLFYVWASLTFLTKSLIMLLNVTYLAMPQHLILFDLLFIKFKFDLLFIKFKDMFFLLVHRHHLWKISHH